MIGSLGIPEILIIGVLLLGIPFWIWMLIEAATKERAESQDRIIWVLVVLIGGFFGALVYFFARRPKRIAELGA
jgi:hypothetical protein